MVLVFRYTCDTRQHYQLRYQTLSYFIQLRASRPGGTWQRNEQHRCDRTGDPFTCQLKGFALAWFIFCSTIWLDANTPSQLPEPQMYRCYMLLNLCVISHCLGRRRYHCFPFWRLHGTLLWNWSSGAVSHFSWSIFDKKKWESIPTLINLLVQGRVCGTTSTRLGGYDLRVRNWKHHFWRVNALQEWLVAFCANNWVDECPRTALVSTIHESETTWLTTQKKLVLMSRNSTYRRWTPENLQISPLLAYACQVWRMVMVYR